MTARPDYGIDGWKYVVGLVGAGAALALAGGVLLLMRAPTVAVIPCLVGAGIALAPGVLGLRYVFVGKFRHRDRLLDRVAWRGDEQTLDLGTGGGLLLVGAARRSPRGRACGIDIWAARDLSNNTRERVLANAALADVGDRVEVLTADARTLPFDDERFDVVMAMLCIHNIDHAEGRRRALTEAVRVCKRGGVVLISDLAHVEDYRDVLEELGLRVAVSGRYLDTFPFQRVVEARRP